MHYAITNLFHCKSNNAPCSFVGFANVCPKFISSHNAFLSTLSPFFFLLITFIQGILSEENCNNPRNYYHHWDIYSGTLPLIMSNTLSSRKRKHRVWVSSMLSWSGLGPDCAVKLSETWGPKWWDIFINIKTEQNDSSLNTLLFTCK